MVAKVKKFIKGVDDTIKVLEITDERHATALIELQILESYLPKQFTKEELVVAITGVIMSKGIARNPKSMGLVMKELKAEYDGQYDGKMASQLVKDILSKGDDWDA